MGKSAAESASAIAWLTSFSLPMTRTRLMSYSAVLNQWWLIVAGLKAKDFEHTSLINPFWQNPHNPQIPWSDSRRDRCHRPDRVPRRYGRTTQASRRPPSITPIFWQLDFREAVTWHAFPIVLTVFIMAFVDTMGTLIGLSARAGFLDEEGKLP